MRTTRGRNVEEILLLLAITFACFLIQTSKCDERKPPAPDYDNPFYCGTNNDNNPIPPNYFEHTDLSFNYRLFISENETFLAIFSEGFGCAIKFYLENTKDLRDEPLSACELEPVEESNFCCVSNSNNHPKYGTKCFDSFDRKYLLQIPDSKDKDGFLKYVYVDDLFFEATSYDDFYNNFYDYFYDHLYYTNDRLKGSNYLIDYSSQFEETTFTSTAATTASDSPQLLFSFALYFIALLVI